MKDFEIKGQVEAIQTMAKIRRDSSRLEETCCHLNSRKKPSANAGVKNSQKSKNNNNDKIMIIIVDNANIKNRQSVA